MARLYDVSVGEWNQFTRLLAESGLTSEEVKAVLSQPHLANYMVVPLKELHVRYTGKLLSVKQQFELICRYNQQYWGGYFSDEELKAYRPKGVCNHQQSVTDLLVLHVEFGSLEETIEMWWKVFQGEQPKHWRWEPLKLDSEHLKLLPSNVATYPARTITQVRINLVSHWEPEEGRTLEEVREQAKQSDEILAHSEVMSAYGLHTELFREQDGDNLPWSDMAGTDVIVPGRSEPYALYLGWDPFRRGAKLDAGWVGVRVQGWAAPVLRES